MQVFNMYFKLIKKCIPIYFIYSIVFLLLVILKINQSNYNYKEDYKIVVGIINNDVTDKFATNLKIYLEKYCDFVYVDRDNTDLEDNIYYDNIDGIISIPYGFMEELQAGDIPTIQLKTLEDVNVNLQLNALLNHYINSFSEYRNYDKELEVDIIFENLQHKLGNSQIVKTNIADNTTADNKFISEFFHVSGYILFGCLFVTVGSVINIYHDTHIKKRIAISLVQDKQMYGHIFRGNFMFTCCLDVILIIISFIVTRNHLKLFTIISYCINILVYSVSALAFIYFIAILYDRKKNTIYYIIIPIVLAFISGVFISQDDLREIVLHIGSFNPLYWFVKNNNDILAYSDTIISYTMIVNVVIQLLFASVFFALSCLLIKEKRERD